ncbi:hypothetical protein GCM10010377_55340 [Streptomyces viridiviolaceus]|uniref:DUF6281 family protein n=1 Tax=Streptomyces viridiviolaceus TaxID=68282 RepID=A0ABW2E2N7_9ACTN|nr:DUF6281 family protein [Streptomyces viridiviolaceus]GHB57217.1 hypothetical protein GCM10010377_55340 [Streptomyces viridiviolaceus]
MRTARTPALAGVALVMVTGCAAGGGGGEAAASCAYVVAYDGRAYRGIDGGDFEVGEAVGVARKPPCDDTPNNGGGGEPAEQLTAYRVVGRDTGTALAVGTSPDDAVLVTFDPDKHGPEVVRELFGEL